jgi:hypothetical protein
MNEMAVSKRRRKTPFLFKDCWTVARNTFRIEPFGLKAWVEDTQRTRVDA